MWLLNRFFARYTGNYEYTPQSDVPLLTSFLALSLASAIPVTTLLPARTRVFRALRVALPLALLLHGAMLLKPLFGATNEFSFRLFTVVYTLTKGGPGDATQIFPTLVYRQAFDFNRFGYASAIAVVSTVLVLALIAIFIGVFRPFRAETD